MLKKGFTLIELLVVIGVLAIIAAGVVALIDPVDKTRQANDARMQNMVAEVATAEESYAAQHNGCYTNSWANLNTAGELKLAAPVLPAGYAAPVFTTVAGTCVAPEVANVTVSVALRSKKYTGATFWKYETVSAKTCNTLAVGTACP